MILRCRSSAECPLLTRGDKGYVPVALALDQAQEVRGSVSAGLGLLGIKAIADEKLTTIQRSTAAILRLAFNVIQHTTDLFGADFPDFTKATEAMIPDTHPLAKPPQLITPRDAAASFGKAVLRQVRTLRASNLRQIAVIVHPDEYWREVHERLVGAGLPLQVLTTRGERVESRAPVVVLTQPGLVGGQEFDAVLVVGLEQGRVPPRVQGNEALASALEQRALREIYVSFTRARYRLAIVNTANSSPSALLADAIRAKLLVSSRDAE
jgi:superfamily I DNA/RNA helicase